MNVGVTINGDNGEMQGINEKSNAKNLNHNI